MHYIEKCPMCGEMGVVIAAAGSPQFVCCGKVEEKSRTEKLVLVGAR